MLVGDVIVGEIHPQSHIAAFGKEKKMIFNGRTHQLCNRAAGFG